MTFLSIRAFAKRDGCSEGLVRRAINEGKLVPDANGRLDAALAGTAWRRANARKGASHHVPAPGADEETVDAVVAKLAAVGNVPEYRVSVARKEAAIAGLRELELDQAVGKVVAVADVADIVGAALATVRERLCSLPSGHAPALCRIKNPAEMHAALLAAIDDCLSELAGVDGLRAKPV